ncbi:hypothetical protein HFRIS_004913 [Herbaspirillum frisingense GSF30]|jgi:hypothetical protein|uniref:Uncharacterized protein n=1 Tax=Herbaspirillum frisingense GSF30 TaxID=864073 RepID=A0AAI9IGE5_9BURK|nr:hypothetical protein [Herbaspirillum frisingense]EOA05771.1 hypothetical protein HFRIS_004913 [Herbaspirillum frisingense GSF30]
MNLLQRLKEPSTHAGIASLIGLATLWGVPTTTVQTISQAAAALLSLAAIFTPEGKAGQGE